MASIISAGTTSGTSLNLSGDTSGVLQLASNGSTTAVTIDTSQNVGIGMSDPASFSSRLCVSGGRLTMASGNRIGFWDSSNLNRVEINSPAQNTMAFYTADGATERMRITSGGLLQFNSGYGSVATAYGCRAWVNFNGTGTPAIRASGNVSSITDVSTGTYEVNFTTAMPDANYAVSISLKPLSDSKERPELDNLTTTNVRVVNDDGLNNYKDTDLFTVAVFR